MRAAGARNAPEERLGGQQGREPRGPRVGIDSTPPSRALGSRPRRPGAAGTGRRGAKARGRV